MEGKLESVSRGKKHETVQDMSHHVTYRENRINTSCEIYVTPAQGLAITR